MIVPEGVLIDGASGLMSVETGRYTKRLRELSHVFRDKMALERLLAKDCDPLVYEVFEYRKEGSDIFFGTTTIQPGKVGDEYYMTRGHFHQRRDMGEVYYTQSGEGILVLQATSGETSTIGMKPGVCAFVPPRWAHRSINTGSGRLVFVWVCNPAAGHDYGDIGERGMRKLVVERDGVPRVIDNPSFANGWIT